MEPYIEFVAALQYSGSWLVKELMSLFRFVDPVRISQLFWRAESGSKCFLKPALQVDPSEALLQDVDTQTCTQSLQCSSFLGMTYFWLRDYKILPKKEPQSSLWVSTCFGIPSSVPSKQALTKTRLTTQRG